MSKVRSTLSLHIILKSKYDDLILKFPELPSYPVNDYQLKVPAAWLIEKAGWKGKRINNYGVYSEQALVLVNYGGASGKDIFKLARDIQLSIKDMFDIELQIEVNVI